jgi:hypothetical protein
MGSPKRRAIFDFGPIYLAITVKIRELKNEKMKRMAFQFSTPNFNFYNVIIF